jgi:hypothetical protein
LISGKKVFARETYDLGLSVLLGSDFWHPSRANGVRNEDFRERRFSKLKRSVIGIPSIRRTAPLFPHKFLGRRKQNQFCKKAERTSVETFGLPTLPGENDLRSPANREKLVRSERNQRTAQRVGDSSQDLIEFVEISDLTN